MENRMFKLSFLKQSFFITNTWDSTQASWVEHPCYSSNHWVLPVSSELVLPVIHISVATAAKTQSNPVIQHLDPPFCSDVVPKRRLMWNINTGVQARRMSSAINYSITRGQNVLIFPYHNPLALWTKQRAFCYDFNRRSIIPLSIFSQNWCRSMVWHWTASFGWKTCFRLKYLNLLIRLFEFLVRRCVWKILINDELMIFSPAAA